MPAVPTDSAVDRRSLLRSGSALLAGVAGLTAVGAAAAPSASAAPGDAVQQGLANNAGTATTSLTSTSPAATLALTNGASGAAVRVGPAADSLNFDAYLAATQSGDLLNDAGSLVFTHDTTEGATLGEVYTDAWANQVVPISPQRALDTRSTAGRSRIVAPGSALDAQGRLIGGKSIEIDLADFVWFGIAGFFNLTVVRPTTVGYASLYPTGAPPGSSSINYLAGQSIANGLVCGLSDFDTVRIFSVRTTHVVLDVSAFWVGSAGQIPQEILLGSAPAAAARSQAQRRSAPSWVTSGTARRS